MFRPEVETTHTLDETQNLLAAINHGKGWAKIYLNLNSAP
jgi:hypothetical protein